MSVLVNPLNVFRDPICRNFITHFSPLFPLFLSSRTKRRTLVSKIELDSVRIGIESGEIYPIAMVVETRRCKRKENPTEEEAPRVKFAKTGSGENVEKTTTEESETKAVEIVESTAKTTDVSMEKTKTTDVSMEKKRKDST